MVGTPGSSDLVHFDTVYLCLDQRAHELYAKSRMLQAQELGTAGGPLAHLKSMFRFVVAWNTRQHKPVRNLDFESGELPFWGEK